MEVQLFLKQNRSEFKIIDQEFKSFVSHIKSLSEKEIYHQIRKSFDKIPEEMKNNFMTFFNQFGYWGYLNMDQHNFEEIELKSKALYQHITDFEWMYEHLADYRSKKLLYSVLNIYYMQFYIIGIVMILIPLRKPKNIYLMTILI